MSDTKLCQPEPDPLRLCREVSAMDDKLGAFSDYEGDEGGPTFHLWREGYSKFADQCDCAIEYHAAAIKVWRRFKKLNEKRRPSSLMDKEMEGRSCIDTSQRKEAANE